MFITYNLKEVSVTRALNVLKEWNPSWAPEISMTDCDHAEVNAIKTCFPSIKDQFYCGFHVLQAWNRAVKGYFKGNKGELLFCTIQKANCTLYYYW